MPTNRTNSTGVRDGRSLDHKTLEELRLRAVALVNDGKSQVSVARAIGMDPAVVCRWVAKARKQGIESLHAKPVPGRPPLLDDRQVEFIRFLVLEIDPTFWGFDSVLWTRAMVACLIERAFGVTLSERAVGTIMRKRMGLSPQRPVRRAFECDEQWGRRWVEQEYPRIKARAEQAGARIYFADEASMKSDYHSGTTWAVRGETPVVGATGQQFSMNLISAISPCGDLRWMEVEGRMTGQKFVEFLEKMIKGRRKPVYVITDNHPTHKAKVVKEFVEKNKDRIELYFVPPYSPHLNPDEQVWNHLKNHTLGKRAIRLVGELKRGVHEHMEWLRDSPKLVRSFFGDQFCKYASKALPVKATPAH